MNIEDVCLIPTLPVVSKELSIRLKEKAKAALAETARINAIYERAIADAEKDRITLLGSNSRNSRRMCGEVLMEKELLGGPVSHDRI